MEMRRDAESGRLHTVIPALNMDWKLCGLANAQAFSPQG